MMGLHPARQGRRVALYARVSSEQQAQEGTIDSQVSLLRQRIAADGATSDAALCFLDDGVSGATLWRPALERLRDQAAAGAIDRLYVLAPDRLARRHVHQMVLVEELQSCGVDVVFVNRPLGTTPEDLVLLQVQGVMAEYERAKILERTRRGRLHAARCGRVSVMSKAPYGYRYIDRHSGGGVAAYEIEEQEARRVRQIFAWVGREGCTLSEVVRRLQQQGVPTRLGRPRWDRATLWGMLSNPAYRGQAAYGKTRVGERRPRLRPRRGKPEVPRRPQSTYTQPASEHILIPVPAVVDADLFAAVQERLENHRRHWRQRKIGPRHLLQGLVVCRCCGYGCYAKVVQGGKNPTVYYRCMGCDRYRFGGRRLCTNRMQRVADLEEAVWKDVCLLLREPDRLQREFERRQRGVGADSSSAESQRLQAARSKAQQGISRLIDAYAEGLLERGEFEPRLKRLKDRLAKLEDDIQQQAAQAHQQEELRQAFSHLQEFADQIQAGLATAEWSQRREILRALVKRVELGERSIHIVYKVSCHPFVKGPEGGLMQDCWRRVHTISGLGK